MEITLDLSEKAVRRIQAYKILTNHRSEDISQLISDIVEEALKHKCAMALDIDISTIGHQTVTQEKPQFDSNYDIMAGFGDEDDTPDPEDVPGEEDEEAQVPEVGVTLEAIDRDMYIENPKIEAKGEADDKMVQEIFPNFKAPILHGSDEFTDSRILKRKKKFSTGKAKVTAYTGADTEEQ